MRSFLKKQKASVSGGVLEYVCSCQGSPTIILLNGAGAPIEGWFRINGDLERLGAVFAYNRFGIGSGAKALGPRSGTVNVAALRELMAIAGVNPPFILVGHLLSGLYANLLPAFIQTWWREAKRRRPG